LSGPKLFFALDVILAPKGGEGKIGMHFSPIPYSPLRGGDGFSLPSLLPSCHRAYPAVMVKEAFYSTVGQGLSEPGFVCLFSI